MEQNQTNQAPEQPQTPAAAAQIDPQKFKFSFRQLTGQELATLKTS